MQSMEREPAAPQPTSAMEDAARCGAMDRLEHVLDDALARDPERLSATLRSDPVRAELQAILTQFDPARLLPVFHRLATSGLPHQHEVLDTLLAADPSGSGQALCATLQALHSQELLARIFHPDRVQALRHACRPLVQEPA